MDVNLNHLGSDSNHLYKKDFISLKHLNYFNPYNAQNNFFQEIKDLNETLKYIFFNIMLSTITYMFAKYFTMIHPFSSSYFGGVVVTCIRNVKLLERLFNCLLCS